MSRDHGFIVRKGKEFWIEDNVSKFGTLIMAKRPIKLGVGTKLAVQVGKTVIRLETVKNKTTCKDLFIEMCCWARRNQVYFVRNIKEGDLAPSFSWADNSMFDGLSEELSNSRGGVYSLRSIDESLNLASEDEIIRSRSEMAFIQRPS